MVKVTATTFRGIEGLSIEDQCLKAVILPSIGGKMTSLQRKASGREWLWQDPGDLLRIPPYGAPLPEYDIGGFQECFPTINECYYPEQPWRGVVVPDHGEVWALPWDVETSVAGVHLWVYGVRFAYRLDKWLRFSNDGKLTIQYELISRAPFDFKYLWSAHPALNLQPGMKMLLPPGTRLRCEFSDHVRLGEMGMLHDWPVTSDAAGQAVDLGMVQTKAARTHDKLNTAGLTAGWCAVYDPPTGEYLAYTFSLSEIPHVGYWLIQGGWPLQGEPYLVGGFEPCTGYPGPLDSAIAWGGHSVLPARGVRRWTLAVYTGRAESGASLIKQLSQSEMG
jgi:hypothetical protein